MNKSLYFKICSIAIGGFTVAWIMAFAIFMLSERNLSERDIPEYPAEEVRKSVRSAVLTHYIARAEEGGITIYEVYDNGFEKPVAFPEIDTRQLTARDLQILREGLSLYSREELVSFIEDYTS